MSIVAQAKILYITWCNSKVTHSMPFCSQTTTLRLIVDESKTIVFFCPLARFPLEEEHVVAEITADTPLVHLLPTTTGAGVCTTVLIDYLVQVHNSFVFRCKGMMNKVQERLVLLSEPCSDYVP